jgi:DNA-directed RNA polymerase specialized sigma24 family protein
MSTLAETSLFGFAGRLADFPQHNTRIGRAVYEANRQRIYALAFWLTDNEPAAEDLMIRTFCRAFRTSSRLHPKTSIAL